MQHIINLKFVELVLSVSQQDCCDLEYGTLLHSYCTGTYTEVTALLLWSTYIVTLDYTHLLQKRVAVLH